MKKAGRIIVGVTAGVLILSIVYTFGGFYAQKIVMSNVFDTRRVSQFPKRLFFQREDYPALAEREEVSFPSGEETLKGSIYRSPLDKGLVLFAHGIGGNRDDQTAILQDYLLGKGYDVFCFDLTSSGESSGAGIHGLHQSAYDVKAALEYLSSREDIDLDRLVFMGYSWGAYGAVASLNFDLPAYPQAIVSFAGFADPEIEMLGMARNYIGGFADFSRWQLDWGLACRAGGDNARLSALEAMKKHSITSYVLVQGDKDTTVPLEASTFEAASKEGLSFSGYLRKGYTHVGLWLEEEAREFAEEMQAYYESLSGENKEERFREYMDSRGGKARASKLDLALMDSIESAIDSSLNP